MLDKPFPRNAYKQHLEEAEGECVFCERRDSLDIKEYENWTLAFAAFPYRKYHTILILKRHVLKFSELVAKELEELAYITEEVIRLYKSTGIVSVDSPFGDQLFFSWRTRDESETEKKAVSHLHMHIYPEIGKEISVIMDQDAWDIDMTHLLPKKH